MKRILFLLSVLVIGLMSCKNDNTAGTPTQQYRGSAAPPVVPDKSKFPREITALTSNFGPGRTIGCLNFT
jgi:hypothetical protein